MDLNCQIKLAENEIDSLKKKAKIITHKIKHSLNTSENLQKKDIEKYQEDYSDISENMKNLKDKLRGLYKEKNKSIRMKVNELNSYKNKIKDCQTSPIQLKLAMSKIAFN